MAPQATFGTPIPAGGQVVAIGAGSTASTTLTGMLNAIRLVSTVDCYVEIGVPGATPTAAANTGLYLVAFVPEYFACGPNVKVAGIQVSASGSLYISQF